MNLYLVSRVDKVDYDQYDAFVVAAATSTKARRMAADACGEHFYAESFTSSVWSTCKCVGIAHIPARVVLGSFNAG